MKIILKKEAAERILSRVINHPELEDFAEKLGKRIEIYKASGDIEIGIETLEPEAINVLEAISKEHDERSLTTQLGTYKRILGNPSDVKITRLHQLELALKEWVLNDVIKGWVFSRTTTGLEAWVVTDIRMVFSRNEEPSVVMSLNANVPELSGKERGSSNGVQTKAFWQNSLPSTPEQLMAGIGLIHETEDLHHEYERTRERFNEIVAQPNMQFRMKPGTYMKAGDRYYNDRKYSIGKSHRCINDDTLVRRVFREGTSREYWDEINTKSNSKNKMGRKIPEEAFVDMPTHYKHLVFDLETHEHVWAGPFALEEYVYDKEKVDMLVLPEDHRELINILTTDADVLLEDVVEGKSGGTIILLEGLPGTGKTLLAEVYAEKMEKALYKVQAGQLGLDAESVSKGIAQIYENAERWKGHCVILIDEADVYIRERGSDMEHNAVVAAMLIAMERQTEMTFLATNRNSDVDEAIISRCIALVHFENPDEEASKQIWKIQAKTMGIDISDDVIDEIVKHHNVGGKQKASGRDIRALLKLAYRYNKQRGREITADLLKNLGAFKRL